ncbi:unnamed protein product [Microthlaspi erraticum]|uniref:RING-type domain-containing protein n=1 Tax=Microthlaspi erraticum TaxID=1685480 RepID=A0A6D2J616_9BRAS|nr:unnamed protein product [Microthlaspi erraticum]
MADLLSPLGTPLVDAKSKSDEKVDYSNLPCPIPYEEIHREAFMSLKAENFEGLRFDFTKGLNQKFSLSHSVMMGPTEVPSQSAETIKIPTAHYEFGANYFDPQLMLVGRVMTDGKLNARVKADLTERLILKANAQLTNEQHYSHAMFNFDYMGSDYRAQLQLGNSALIGATYIQSVTPRLSLGGEVFWAGVPRKSGIGYAARYETDKMVSSAQVASTGVIVMNYVQKISDKVSLATDFMYNYFSRDVTASVGYDYMLRQSRVRGKIDSNGVASALLEERLSMGLNFLLSAELDHKKKDYKFGFGLTILRSTESNKTLSLSTVASFFSNSLLPWLIRFLRSSSADSSVESVVEGDLMMDSAIEISSSSSECSEDESPEPIEEEVRTRRNPSWLGGNSSFYQSLASAANNQAKAGQTNQASRNVPSTSTSRPGDSKQSTTVGNTVNSGVDDEKQSSSSQQAPRRTLPPSFSLPPVPSPSATTSTSRPGDSKQSTVDGNIVNSRAANVSGVDYEKQSSSSQQAPRRTLPPSFSLPPVPSTSATTSTSRPRNGNSVTSRIPSVSGVEYKKHRSQQAPKRTLPPSISLPPVPSRNANSISSGSVSRFGGDYTSPALGNKSTFGDRHRGAHTEIGIHRGINGVRILPPSMTHGTSATPLHYGGSSDPMHRTSLGEDRNPENDETLIYQAALQDLNQPKTEADLRPGTLSVPLMRHQKIALAWMFQKETKSLNCSGGILADDQGLGKTVSTIALILKQKFESQLNSENSSQQVSEILDLDADDESENAKHESNSQVKSELKISSNSETKVMTAGGSDENGSSDMEKVKDEEVSTSTRAFNRKRPAAGTLIVCPASVVRQWARELDEKVSDECKLSVLVYHGGNRTKDPVELAKYDVVVTTYAIVTNEVPKKPLVDEEENDEKNTEKRGLASGFPNNRKRKAAMGASKKRKKRGRESIDDDSSFDPDCGTLARVGWLRIVLDEAQTIKNHTTQVARACCFLRAKRRWCLSGTPIQNSIKDLYSYFRFLKYNPYAVYKSFHDTIKVPISRNSLQGYKKLQAVLRAIMLRRTKGTLLDGKPIINLPPKKLNLSQVDFSVEERSFYMKLQADSRSQFKAYKDAGTVSQNYANILLLLLRLRQACDHPQLIKGHNADPVGKLSQEAVKKLPRDARINLLNRLESSSAICCDCEDPPENPVVSLCGHVFCYQCVLEHINGYDNMCPGSRCREQLGRDVVFSVSALRNCISNDSGCSSSHDKGLDKSVFERSEFRSSKIKAVLDILQSLSKQGSPNSAQPYDGDDDDVTIVEPMNLHSSSPSQGPVKTIVFSQWTSMLDLVQLRFNENGIEFRRLDGTMSLAARDRAVKEFSNDPYVKVMLMSLKAGNLGLNMVAACHVILLDLWWNPTTEDQAIDRAHRIGQTRPVTVTRITIKDTIEDKILRLQDEKRKMAASAFGEEHGGSSATRLTVDDLNYLFNV